MTDVNKAPISTNDSVQAYEDTKYAFTANDFGTFTDVDAGNTLHLVRIDSLPADGDLYYKGSLVTTTGLQISVADLQSGNLVYLSDNNSDTDTSFKYSVSDGSLWSTSSRVLSRLLYPAADKPTLSASVVEIDANSYLTSLMELTAIQQLME